MMASGADHPSPAPLMPPLLVVEDDPLVRLTLADVLSESFEVIEAGDAEEALRHLHARPDIAALMTDINLPGGADGFTLARMVRVCRPGLPVLYASGRYARIEEGRGVEGATFLAKPFPPSEAAAELRRLMTEAAGRA